MVAEYLSQKTKLVLFGTSRNRNFDFGAHETEIKWNQRTEPNQLYFAYVKTGTSTN